MKLKLHTEGWFDACHNLNNYEGACANKHGHTYKIEVWVKGLSSQLDKSGILWDFVNLKNITSKMDHKDLNKLYLNPTAEKMCIGIYNILKSKNKELSFKVRLYEQLEPKKSYVEGGDFE